MELEPLDYSIAAAWLQRRLDRAAVVDFLFHPDALWWFDHHTTTFATEHLRRVYQPDAQHRWDAAYPSCPPLIFDVIGESENIAELRREFDTWVHWCNIIDAARYESPQQATRGDAACLLINQALGESADPELRRQLVMEISQGNAPEELSKRSYIAPLWQSFRSKVDEALSVIGMRLQRIGQVGLCDIASSRALFLRYGVYYFAPEVRYSIIAYNAQRGSRPYKISLSFNPWLRRGDEPLNLGAVAREYGGGGRENVGSIAFESPEECSRIAGELARRLDR